MKGIKITIQFPNDETRIDFETWFFDVGGCSEFNAHQELNRHPLLKFNIADQDWTAQTAVPRGSILIDPTFNARGKIDEKATLALARSIKLSGLPLPIVVRPKDKDGKYFLTSGFRRMAAIEILGWSHVPVLVMNSREEKEFFEDARYQPLGTEAELTPRIREPEKEVRKMGRKCSCGGVYRRNDQEWRHLAKYNRWGLVDLDSKVANFACDGCGKPLKQRKRQPKKDNFKNPE